MNPFVIFGQRTDKQQWMKQDLLPKRPGRMQPGTWQENKGFVSGEGEWSSYRQYKSFIDHAGNFIDRERHI